MSQYGNRAARLMHSMGDGKRMPEETGAGGAAAGSTGASVGGDAGLSQLGALPNGSVGIATGKRMCRPCGVEVGQSAKWCPECGGKIQESAGSREASHEYEDRFNQKQREIREQDESSMYHRTTPEQRMDTVVNELMKTMRRTGTEYFPDSRIAEERLQGQFYRLLGEFMTWRLQEGYTK